MKKRKKRMTVDRAIELAYSSLGYKFRKIDLIRLVQRFVRNNNVDHDTITREHRRLRNDPTSIVNYRIESINKQRIYIKK